MRAYSVRIENEDGAIIAWIDIDGNPVIRQPHAPGLSEAWVSESEAQSWANEHILLLQQNDQAVEEEAARQQALIAQAQADSERLARIEEKLDQLLGN